MDLLRVSTAGSVDDGKSTLIGRMLYDSKGLLEDQLEAARRATRNDTAGEIDLSLLTDGLRAEREQGITIDVAYRYFATPKRKFILADTPGHEQYTRNMATGASTADLAVVLIDARKGVLEQSRRHTAIATLLGIPKLVVTVNKMDLVAYAQDAFASICDDFRAACKRLGAPEPTFIPVSALRGDNVVTRSPSMPWYEGPSLLELLETVEVPESDGAPRGFRLPVQLVLRPDHNFRGFAGRITSGRVAVGDEIEVLPSGRRSRVRRIHTYDGDLEEAAAPRSVSLLLDDEIDISRGDLLVRAGEAPRQGRVFEASLVWMDDHPLVPGRPWLLRQGTRVVRATVAEIVHRRNVVTLDEQPATELKLNDVGRVRIETAQPIYLDAYERFRHTGCFILVDPESNATSGAGMISGEQRGGGRGGGAITRLDRSARAARYGHKGAVVWLTGLSGAGKSAVAHAAESRLFLHGAHVFALDAAELRDGLCVDLGNDEDQRTEQIRRAAEAARLFAGGGQLTLVALALPLRAHRELARRIVGDVGFLEVHTSAPLAVCAQRDPKGLYARTRAGETHGLPGVDAPYEEPTDADVVLPTHERTLEECVEALVVALFKRGILREQGAFKGGSGI